MAFHTTSSGVIVPCGASVRSCPRAPAEEHYPTIKEASRALALEALERQSDFDLAPLPAGWGTVAPPSLNSEFALFQKSAAAKAPPPDMGDWRETLAQKAETNGDSWYDANPDTSVVFGGYYEPDVD